MVAEIIFIQIRSCLTSSEIISIARNMSYIYIYIHILV